MLKALIVTASVAAATAAFAGPQRLSDVQYMQLARCQALIGSTALGAQDTAAVDAAYKSQRISRDPFIYDRAEQIHDDTVRAAKRAGPDQKAHLIAERDGVCRDLVGGVNTAGVASRRPQSLN
ncbi:MAG TPA: hypothetical protein VG939_14770 [Caulobacteraceae bacterium]|nr:hypothetical protein [Caulobacteraceae bacterium]